MYIKKICRAHQENGLSGFTLIEILVVLVIIGILSTVVALNVGARNHGAFSTDLFKISNMFEALADEAVYTNSIIACEFEDGASCRQYKNGEWSSFNLNTVASWKWPSNIRIVQIVVDSIPLKDGEPLRFSANGEVPHISIQVTDGKNTAWIDSEINGEFKVHY